LGRNANHVWTANECAELAMKLLRQATAHLVAG
jgi:hypothetical protein